MNYFEQNVPIYAPGYTPFSFAFTELAELLDHPCVCFFSAKRGFFRFSKFCDNLIAEFDGGKISDRVGTIRFPELLDLPTWPSYDA